MAGVFPQAVCASVCLLIYLFACFVVGVGVVGGIVVAVGGGVVVVGSVIVNVVGHSIPILGQPLHAKLTDSPSHSIPILCLSLHAKLCHPVTDTV